MLKSNYYIPESESHLTKDTNKTSLTINPKSLSNKTLFERKITATMKICSNLKESISPSNWID